MILRYFLKIVMGGGGRVESLEIGQRSVDVPGNIFLPKWPNKSLAFKTEK
jgi:hypothetical protein